MTDPSPSDGLSDRWAEHRAAFAEIHRRDSLPTEETWLNPGAASTTALEKWLSGQTAAFEALLAEHDRLREELRRKEAGSGERLHDDDRFFGRSEQQIEAIVWVVANAKVVISGHYTKAEAEAAAADIERRHPEYALELQTAALMARGDRLAAVTRLLGDAEWLLRVLIKDPTAAVEDPEKTVERVRRWLVRMNCETKMTRSPSTQSEHGVENLARYLWLLARLSDDEGAPQAIGEWANADDGVRAEFRATAEGMARALAGEDPVEVLRS